MNYVPSSWGDVLAFFGVLSGCFWFLRRLVLSELNTWKAEMEKLINEKYDVIEQRFVTKETLGLKLDVIAERQASINVQLGRVELLIQQRNVHDSK